MCKLCTIEHSSSWTCAQAAANQEAFVMKEPCVEGGVQEALSEAVWEAPVKNRSERMKAWWRTNAKKG